MKNIIAGALKGARPSEFPTGQKLEQPSNGLVVPTFAQNMGPATTAPTTTTAIGSIEMHVIHAPEKDPDAEPPSIWTDAPAWLTAADL